jgi:hypothetical protein
VPPHEHKPIEQILARLRDRDRQFRFWLKGLRDREPPFARASVLQADDMGEWQAAVYLLTGCEHVWTALGPEVCADRSIAPAIEELDQPCRAWSSSERAVMRWAAHFWDVSRWPTGFPYVFEEFYFRRWIAACHLYKHIPPEPCATDRNWS